MGAQETGFDGTMRFSDYLPLADGTRLAYDLILPAIAGRPGERPLPALFKYTPYLRAYAIRGEQEKSRVAELYRMPPAQRAVLQDLDLFDPGHRTGWLAALVQQGYAAIVVERPGTGASFGTMDPTLAGTAREADQVLDWIAAQDWCNGRIGMWGDSWQGQTQLAAASTGNPHLKAIMPSATPMDAYGACYQGGIYNQAFARFFVWSTAILNSSIITPVDTDPDGSVLAQARAERAGSAVGQTMTDAVWRAFPFRDSEIASGQPMWEYVSAGRRPPGGPSVAVHSSARPGHLRLPRAGRRPGPVHLRHRGRAEGLTPGRRRTSLRQPRAAVPRPLPKPPGADPQRRAFRGDTRP
jgi:putative CocE/NonD family hydrolase